MEWTKEKVNNIVINQRNFFNTNKTLPIKFRIEQLKKLKQMVIENQELLERALYEDLGRSDTEAYFCDIGSVILEINETIKGIKKWARPENHHSGLLCFPSTKTKVYKMPYGVTLIISPFNFPILLSLGVLTASIAGGNTAVIKCSSKSKACTQALQEIISKTFPKEYITVIDGGHDVADYCLEERFDKIFYTGSPEVGKHVMNMASKNLTPVALELGGETGNWCIIRKDADLKDAARKIAFFKSCNAGQICININQIAIDQDIAEKFIELLKEEFKNQLGNIPHQFDEYPKLINKSAFIKCSDEAAKYRSRIIFGGTGDIETLKYSPTIIYPVDADEDIVNHELFNPLLPIVPYTVDTFDDLLNKIVVREHGLALYLFTKDLKWAKKMMSTLQYGGGCINEVCLHLMVKGVPFNGTGHSGMGAYHGEWGFKEFTHPQTCLIGKTNFNLPLRVHPYSGKNSKFMGKPKKYWLKKFLK